MGTRIHVQSIYTPVMPGFGDGGYDAINDGVMRMYQQVLRPDTEVRPQFLPRSTYYTSHVYLEMINNIEVVRGVIQGEQDGYDVAFVRCGNDPGIREAREMVRYPVVGMTEAAMAYAMQLGSKFALIGVDEKSAPIVERNLRLYGLENRAIANPARVPKAEGWDEGLHHAPRWFTDTDYVFDKVVPAFEECARGAIADGAEVIVTSCALYSAFTLAGYNKVSGTEVPVLESVAVGVKQAEMMGDLHRSLGLTTSKHRTYFNYLQPEMRDQLMAPFFPDLAEKASS